MKKPLSQNVIILGLLGTGFFLGALLYFLLRIALFLSVACLTADLLHHIFK